MIKFITFLSVLVLAASCSNSTEFNFESTNSDQTQSSVASAESTDFSYDNYAQILTQYVNDQGKVDYQSLKQNRQPLDSFHDSIATLFDRY